VDVLQGYHYSKPLPFAQVTPWLDAHQGRTLPAQGGTEAHPEPRPERLAVRR
jgi:hypothetical protein